MKINLKIFGMAKDLVGSSLLIVELDKGTTVTQLKDKLQKDFDGMKQMPSYMVAINGEYADEDRVVLRSDEVAIIPPTSGG